MDMKFVETYIRAGRFRSVAVVGPGPWCDMVAERARRAGAPIVRTYWMGSLPEDAADGGMAWASLVLVGTEEDRARMGSILGGVGQLLLVEPWNKG